MGKQLDCKGKINATSVYKSVYFDTCIDTDSFLEQEMHTRCISLSYCCCLIPIQSRTLHSHIPSLKTNPYMDVANVLRQVSNRYCPTNVYSIPHNHNSTKSCLSCSFLLFQTLQTPSDPCHYKQTYNCRQRMSSTPRYPIHFEELLLPNFQSEIVYVVYQRQVPL